MECKVVDSQLLYMEDKYNGNTEYLENVGNSIETNTILG
jgi:hypothetical protein